MKTRSALLLGAAAVGVSAAAREYWLKSHEDSLAGEVALITGGSRGLGLALAREFAAEGCRIALCARVEDELAAAVSDLRSRGAEVFAFAADVSRQDDVDTLIAAVTAHFGRIDILVNNAGVIQVGPVQNFDPADFEEAMQTNFWGTVRPTLAVLPQFLQSGKGRIVNISSIGGKVSMPHLLPYVSSKYAVAGFSQGLAAELGPQGIKVTAIFPGLLRTGSFVQALFKGDQKKEAEWFTLGASLPGISMDPARAARQIVRAVRRGERDLTLSLPAKTAAVLNGLFPGGVGEILSVVSSAILPAAASGKKTKSGGSLWPALHPAVRAVSALGVRAMRNYNQKA